MREGLLDAAGQAFSPGQPTGEMLAVVDLDQGEVVAVEAAAASMEKRCLHLGLALIERFELDDIKAPAVNVPFVKHCDEAAHKGTCSASWASLSKRSAERATNAS
jgi:hypothetical protein